MSKGDAELAALIAAVDGDVQLQIEVGNAIGKFRRRRDIAINAKEAADLLPVIGYKAVAERKGCHPSTVYRREARSRKKVFARTNPLA